MTPALSPFDRAAARSRRTPEATLATVLDACGDPRVGRVATALGRTDPAVLCHGAAVAELALAMGARAGLSDAGLAVLAGAALLHDAGKRYVPAIVLDKPAALAPHERQVVEAHAAVGASMLLEESLIAEALIVRHHHERWDGAGYPDRLFGTAIPLESRLILVADAFDAMTSDRAYRAALPAETALAEIAAAAGRQLDPECAALLPEVV